MANKVSKLESYINQLILLRNGINDNFENLVKVVNSNRRVFRPKNNDDGATLYWELNYNYDLDIKKIKSEEAMFEWEWVYPIMICLKDVIEYYDIAIFSLKEGTTIDRLKDTLRLLEGNFEDIIALRVMERNEVAQIKTGYQIERHDIVINEWNHQIDELKKLVKKIK